MNKPIILIAALLTLTACGKSDPKPEKCDAYTIWFGSPAFAKGHGVDEIVKDGDFYVIGGDKYPYHQLLKISENDCAR